MNLMFWNRKKTAEEDGASASDKTVATNPEIDQPAKPGWLARLRARVAAIKLPSRKKGKPAEEEGSEPSAEHADNEQPDRESEPPTVLPAKPGKWRPLVLALLILLAAGGGFAAREWLLPPQHQKMQPPAGAKAVQPEAVPQRDSRAPRISAPVTAVPGPQHAQETAAVPPVPAATASHPPAEAQANAAATTGSEMQAQIETLKKQNQEMREQLDTLKKQSKQPSPVAATPPREGVLIISGKEVKESAQGLKKVIEEMNAASDSQGARKPAK